SCLSIENEFVPEQISISAYPNPFNPELTIGVNIPLLQHTLISVIDLTGRNLEKIFEGNISPGAHTFSWEAGGYPSGVYLISVNSGPLTQTQKVLLLK
ncbi:MAG: T9SS type A sorting domain-containing protein, partial [Candidatus Marinimicrobia bacterium]|nr:T9SS type A sorting domain-containing protein [Candidatus Neomarinimicrobiota bacterium]